MLTNLKLRKLYFIGLTLTHLCCHTEKIKSVKLLGVHLTSTLTTEHQANFVLNTISQRFYLLHQLIRQGLGMSPLNVS